MAPILFNKVDVNQITFTAPKPSKSGGKILNPEYMGVRPTFQTPLMPLAWTTNVRRNEDSGSVACKLALSFKNTDEDSTAFMAWQKSIDELVLEAALKNRATWFPKNVDENKVRAYFFPSVKTASDDKYADTFQPKIALKEVDPTADDINAQYAMDVKVFSGEDKSVLPSSALTGGSLCSAIVEFSYIWISATMFGSTFTCRQVLAFPREELNEFAFDLTPAITAHKKRANEAEPEEVKESKVAKSEITDVKPEDSGSEEAEESDGSDV
jgi:hypothetical protein